MKPLNRHLLIQPLEEKQEEKDSVVILPSDYEKPLAPYVIAKVIDHADDCQKEHDVGSTIVLERRMLNTLEIHDKTYYLVLENYLFGRLDE